MNIEELKNSDKLDLYILGLLPEHEAQEVEELLFNNPELLIETRDNEEALLTYATGFSKQPAPELKVRVMDQINALNGAQKTVKNETVTVGINNSGNYKLYRIAASVLLLVSMGLSYVLVQKNATISNLTEKLTTNDIQLADRNTQFSSLRSTLNSLYENNVKQVKLKSTDTTKNVYATFFYNKATKQLLVHQGNLEKREDGMQYQVWALIDGKPYSAGVFDAEPTAESLKVISTNLNAQLFAVSIEKQGGAVAPTPERIILISNPI